MMKITAVTKYKNGTLYNALKNANISVAELSRQCGASRQSIYNVVNLKKRPSAELAQKIQNKLSEHGQYIDICGEWPESFEGFNKMLTVEQTQEVDVLSIESSQEAMSLTFEEKPFDEPDCEMDFFNAVEFLDKREHYLVTNKLSGSTFKQCADGVGLSVERCRQIHNASIRKIKRLISASATTTKFDEYSPYDFASDKNIDVSLYRGVHIFKGRFYTEDVKDVIDALSDTLRYRLFSAYTTVSKLQHTQAGVCFFWNTGIPNNINPEITTNDGKVYSVDLQKSRIGETWKRDEISY